MNSTQLDLTRGTRGEIARLIGSPSCSAQEHYGCPGQSRQYIPITVTHPPRVPHGLVPIDVPRKIYRWPMCCITLSPTDMWYVVCHHTNCRRALQLMLPSTVVVFWGLPHISPTDLPALGMPQCMPQPISHPLPCSPFSLNEWPLHYFEHRKLVSSRTK